MNVGDLIVPRHGSEAVYESLEMMSGAFVWNNKEVGMVLQLIGVPNKRYHHVKVLVGDKVGWTWSDFVDVHNEI